MPGLYLHIPFCIKKCKYCDFTSYADAENQMDGYVDALIRDMRQYQSFDFEPFTSVYMGGGTPSLLPAPLVERLFHALYRHFPIHTNAEISMECNPGALSPDALDTCRRAGVNRVSLGAQSTDDALLSRIGRIHTRQSIFEAFSLLRQTGFSNINIDIMHGLPGQSTEDYLASIQMLLTLNPTHISAYSLILEEGTPLYDEIQEGLETLPDQDEVCAMQDAGIGLLARQGYARYEVSNFAKPGYACLHNLNYWENGAYIGLGAGAHSAWRLPDGTGREHWTRFENPPSLEAYSLSLDIPMEQREKHIIPPIEEAFETVMLGLRMLAGIHLPAFTARFGAPLDSFFPQSLKKLQKNGLIQADKTHVRATARGMDLLNQVLQEFLAEMNADFTA